MPEDVIKHQVVAINVSIVGGLLMLDLPYTEDVAVSIDLNVVISPTRQLVEIQETSKKEPFVRSQLTQLIDLAEKRIRKIALLHTNIVDSL